MKILFLLGFIFVCFTGVCQNNDVTWLSGRILEIDKPGVHKIEKSIAGYTHHYGTQHVKILTNKSDTLIVVRVFNLLEDQNSYLNNFGLDKNKSYVFILSEFDPCNSSFPRLTGGCEEGFFYPNSTRLIDSYSKIFRIISSTERSVDSN